MERLWKWKTAALAAATVALLGSCATVHRHHRPHRPHPRHHRVVVVAQQADTTQRAGNSPQQETLRAMTAHYGHGNAQ